MPLLQVSVVGCNASNCEETGRGEKDRCSRAAEETTAVAAVVVVKVVATVALLVDVATSDPTAIDGA